MRKWSNGGQDTGSVHVLGNGRMIAYGQGPEWIQVFGPPYSTPNLCALTMEAIETESVSERQRGAALWTHTLTRAGEALARMTDFVDAERCILVRQVAAAAPFSMRICPDAGAQIEPWGACALVSGAPGRYVFARLPVAEETQLGICVQGAASLQWDAQGCRVAFDAGESALYFVGGEAYPEIVEARDEALAREVSELRARTEAYWAAFTARRRAFAFREDPLRERFEQAVDDVAVLIKAQQSETGGVLAGYPYHMYYVRDQFGVSRGLLALGYWEEARRLLGFYARTYQKWGAIHNAQCEVRQGLFHVHEEDRAEITGYLIAQAFEYGEASGDWAFVREIFPMLEWAYEAQAGLVREGMLPFNGDETYVAGGLLPRTTLEDGSAEATLLFWLGGGKLAAFAQRERLWPEAQCRVATALVRAVGEQYAENFVVEGVLSTNQPQRRSEGKRFRYGVCEGCMRIAVWTERDTNGRYRCVTCANGGEALPAGERERYFLPSVSLFAPFVGAALPEEAVQKRATEAIARTFLETGRLPSRPDRDACVGYDYGLLLHAMTRWGIAGREKVFEGMLRVLDDTGAWCEYYAEHRAYNTRCRPWESGINLWAGIEYLER